MKTRLLGAAVLLALLVLFVPMFFPSTPPASTPDEAVSLAIPPAPDRDLQTKTMSLTPDATPAASSTTPVIPSSTPGSSDQLATVDISSRRPRDVEGDNPASAQATTSAASKPSERKPPPAVAPKNEPVVSAPPAAASGSYSLNLSAYSSSAGASNLMGKVRALGYPVRSFPVRQRGKTLTMVTAGPFETRTAAESARLKITQAIKGVPARLESSPDAAPSPVPAAPKATTKTATAAPASPAASARPKAGGWAVQVAAMSSEPDANALRDKLRANGFDGFVDSVSVGSKRLWRVRAGPQADADAAAHLRDQIQSKLKLSGIVVPVP